MERPGFRLKRIAPLVKARRLQFERECSKLVEIRNRKKHAQEQLHTNQRMYIDGVEQLNSERQSPDHSKLLTLERGLDFVKAKWYQSLKELQRIEKTENVQLSVVLNAQKNLKKMEKLEDRYRSELQVIETREEQKAQDEAARRQFAKE